jgi:flagellar protein FlgJ
MDTSLLKRQVVTDFNSFIEMKAQAKTDKNNTLTQAAKEFEALFLQNMVKSMRKANDFLSENSPLKSNHINQFQEMLDKQQALEISNNTKGIGLAEMMLQQMDKKNQIFQHQANNHPNGINLPQNSIKTKILEFVKEGSVPMTPQSFVEKLWPIAKAVAQEIGFDPKVLIAQAAHETGWGQHIIKDENGTSSNNLFNIKGSTKWQNGQTYITTTEYIEGQPKKVKEPFRNYESVYESFKDYVSLITGKQRYSEAVQQIQNPQKYMEALQEAGYATDPLYANKVMAIYNGKTLNAIVAGMEK